MSYSNSIIEKFKKRNVRIAVFIILYLIFLFITSSIWQQLNRESSQTYEILVPQLIAISLAVILGYYVSEAVLVFGPLIIINLIKITFPSHPLNISISTIGDIHPMLKNYVFNQLKEFTTNANIRFSTDPSILIYQKLERNIDLLVNYIELNIPGYEELNVADTALILRECVSLANPIQIEMQKLYLQKKREEDKLKLEIATISRKIDDEIRLFGKSDTSPAEIAKLKSNLSSVEASSLDEELKLILDNFSNWNVDPIELLQKQFITVPGYKKKVRICCYQTARLNEAYCLCGRAISAELKDLLTELIDQPPIHNK